MECTTMLNGNKMPITFTRIQNCNLFGVNLAMRFPVNSRFLRISENVGSRKITNIYKI